MSVGRRRKEERSSATSNVRDVTDVTDVSPMSVGRRKKEEVNCQLSTAFLLSCQLLSCFPANS
ncbi:MULTISPECIES: hypothetical protein [Microcoleaceae]|uniref:hypothetical protein n=1 Tax=Microcoleaceae TaxID=1892252 RepID=UPI001882743C|nr:hypothetical protein [Tychonema sp. LEGE 06208]MBE9162339.1 hypothetical protein [Tychonema sp. LEGE 06208]